MRILFDARSVRTPAGEHVFQGLLKGWRADPRVAALVAAVTPRSRLDGAPEGIEVVRLPHTAWIRHLTRDLPALATRCRADIIFSPNATPPRDERAVLYFQDLKHVRRDQHHRLAWRHRAGEIARSAWTRVAAPKCALAVCVSNDIADTVRRSLPLPVSVIPNGVEVGGVWWSGAHDAVVVMGGIGPWKGEELAVRAWSMLERSTRGATVLDVIGVEPLGRRQSLLALGTQLGVADSMRVRGVIGRREFLCAVAEGRAAVSCSEFESFGLPVAEALMMGAPVICSDLPAHVELLTRASAGAAFGVGDPEALAALLRKLLSGEVVPRRLTPPDGWSWNDRARQHVDAFLKHVPHVRH